MEIVIIRHAKVNMTWEKAYDSKGFDSACSEYDTKEISNVTEKISNKNVVYISSLPRTYETACKLFDSEDFYKTSLINEVPLRSFKDTNKKYPLWVWNIVGRLQWMFNNKRQIETRNETIVRAHNAIDIIESNNKDCFVITHGFYMMTLIKELRHRGYKIQKKHGAGIANLEKIIASK